MSKVCEVWCMEGILGVRPCRYSGVPDGKSVLESKDISLNALLGVKYTPMQLL